MVKKKKVVGHRISMYPFKVWEGKRKTGIAFLNLVVRKRKRLFLNIQIHDLKDKYKVLYYFNVHIPLGALWEFWKRVKYEQKGNLQHKDCGWKITEHDIIKEVEVDDEAEEEEL